MPAFEDKNDMASYDSEAPGSGTAGTYIPATQRPDGSWRKARRVKEGYVPQEEVPLYESKGKQWAKSQSTYPPGLNPVVSSQTEANSQLSAHIIPGLTTIVSDVSKSSKKKKKKKSKSENSETVANNVSDQLQKLQISPGPKKEETDCSTVDPAKKLKNLKKKMREIENLESRIQSGELAQPEKEQLDKIARKEEIEMLIEEIEAELENS